MTLFFKLKFRLYFPISVLTLLLLSVPSWAQSQSCEQEFLKLQDVLDIVDRETQRLRETAYAIHSIPTIDPTEQALMAVAATFGITINRIGALRAQKGGSPVSARFEAALEEYKKDPTSKGAFLAYVSRVALPQIGEVRDLSDRFKKENDLRQWKASMSELLRRGEAELVSSRAQLQDAQLQLPCFASEGDFFGFSVKSKNGDRFNFQENTGVSFVSFGPLSVGDLAKAVIADVLIDPFSDNKGHIRFIGDIEGYPNGPSNHHGVIWDADLLNLDSGSASAYLLISEGSDNSHVIKAFQKLGSGPNLPSAIHAQTIASLKNEMFGFPMSLMQETSGRSERIIIFQKDANNLIKFRVMDQEFSDVFQTKTVQKAILDFSTHLNNEMADISAILVPLRDAMDEARRKKSEALKKEISLQENGLLREQGLYPEIDYWPEGSGFGSRNTQFDADLNSTRCAELCSYYRFGE